MPELPEVETVVRDLEAAAVGQHIVQVWLGAPSLVRNIPVKDFVPILTGARISRVQRIGKNVVFTVLPVSSTQHILAVHPKMTGHFLLGRWTFNNGDWHPQGNNPELSLWMNRSIRMLFHLDSGLMLAFSDVRKFSRVLLGPAQTIISSKAFSHLGPDALSKTLTPEYLSGALAKTSRIIKQVLLDQTLISGIGNIYADEVLWAGKIHPQRRANTLSKQEVESLLSNIREILERSIALKGSSMATFRHLSGEAGGYGAVRTAYKRTGQPCSRCGTPISRIIVGSRSTHFCPACQT